MVVINPSNEVKMTIKGNMNRLTLSLKLYGLDETSKIEAASSRKACSVLPMVIDRSAMEEAGNSQSIS